MKAGTYRVVFRRPKAVVAGFGVAFAACAYLCTSLALDTDLLNLLPEDIQAIRSIRKLEGWDGATAFHYVGLVRDEQTSVQTLKRFGDEIGVGLNKSKWLKPTQVGVDIHRIKKAAALFLDPDDLRAAGERVLDHVKRERKKATGFYLDLDDEEDAADVAKALSFDDLLPKYKRRFQWSESKKPRAKGAGASSVEECADIARKIRAKLNDDGTILYYLSEDARMLVWLTAPIFRPRELDNYPAMQADVDAAVAAARERMPEAAGIDLHIGGGYALEWDQRVTTLRDAARATALASVLILLVIAFTVRRLRSVVLVFLSLIVGMVITFGVVQLTIGRLNVVTVFLMAILGGLGIDFGLYFATRFTRMRRRGMTREEASEQAWVQTATPALMGALTTTSATALLAFGQFQGFAELGVICSVGILSTWAAMYGLLPALYLLLMPVAGEVEPGSPEAAAAQSAAEGGTPMTGHAGDWSPLFLGAAVVVTLALAWSARDVRFAVTGKELTVDDQPSLVIDQKIIDHYGENVDPTLILAETEAEARGIQRYFEEHFGEFETIRRYESAFTYVPPADRLEATLEAIKPLKKALRRMPGKVEDPEEQWFLDQARQLVDPAPLTVEELPTHIQRVYLGRDQAGKTVGYVGHVIPNDWLWEVEYLQKHVDEVGAIRINGKPIEATGRPQILLRLIQIVQEEATFFSLVGALLILLMFWVQTRSLRFALLCMLPLLVGTVWTLGVLPLLGPEGLWLSFVNLTIVPVLIGLAVSYGVHLVHNYRLYGSAERSLRVTGRAVMGSALTTLIGWSALLPASMIGMRRIGQLACVGMITVTLVSLIVLPAALGVLDRRGWIRPHAGLSAP